MRWWRKVLYSFIKSKLRCCKSSATIKMESYNWTTFSNLKASQEKFVDLDIKIKVLKRIVLLSLGTFGDYCASLFLSIHSTLPTADILSGKNVRAWVSMDFTWDKYLAPRKIEKMKILGAVSELPAKLYFFDDIWALYFVLFWFYAVRIAINF